MKTFKIENSATGYALDPRLKQIQDEDAGRIFRETASASSISDNVNRNSKNHYNYRDEVSVLDVNASCRFIEFSFYYINKMFCIN